MKWFLPAALAAGLAVSSPAVAQTEPADAAQIAASQAAIVKLNAYVGLLNRTLRAEDSLQRYEEWVDMKKGPTGREKIIYGLYSVYDVRSEIAEARKVVPLEPAMPDLDAAVEPYITAYEALAPILNKAEAYYERQDYKSDKMAEGKALHQQIASAASEFRKARENIDVLFAAEKAKSDDAELAAIEKHEGRKARWHLTNVMIKARQLSDLLPSEKKPVVDMKIFDEALDTYAVAVRGMDEFSQENPNSFFVFEGRPRSWLGKMREFRDKLAKTKGDARRGSAGRDLTWIVNDYNMMISTADSALSFSR
ncbi:YiiG family protein [Terrihabitans sp. B22-R8]|uniref:YiiG family protein n=1 Tax=Terrihabitans sp. B22-R8 TaxID=3425128 RepID=UPI00403D22B8